MKNADDLYDALRRFSKELKKEADYLIDLKHDGNGSAYVTIAATMRKVALEMDCALDIYVGDDDEKSD